MREQRRSFARPYGPTTVVERRFRKGGPPHLRNRDRRAATNFDDHACARNTRSDREGETARSPLGKRRSTRQYPFQNLFSRTPDSALSDSLGLGSDVSLRMFVFMIEAALEIPRTCVDFLTSWKFFTFGVCRYFFSSSLPDPEIN